MAEECEQPCGRANRVVMETLTGLRHLCKPQLCFVLQSQLISKFFADIAGGPVDFFFSCYLAVLLP